MDEKALIVAIVGAIICLSVIFATFSGEKMQVRRQLQRRVRRLEDIGKDIDDINKKRWHEN